MKKKITALLTCAMLCLLSLSALPSCGSAELVYTLSDDETHYIVSVSGSASALKEAEILEEYEGLPVTEIASQAFNGCSSLTSIVIPDSITTIGSSAFIYCSSLTSVTLSQNLTAIPYGIFGECTSLKTVEIPASVTSINSYAFMYSYITEITIPSTVEYLGSYVFYGCERLVSADIQCEITYVPHGTFYNCDSMTTVTLPSTITEIKGYEEETSEDGETIYRYAAFSYGAISLVSSYYTYDYVLQNIYFRGTEEQWNAITVGDNNLAITEDTVITYNYAG